MGDFEYREDPAAMNRFTGWDGPIGRDFQRRVNTLLYRVQADAPRKTGKMASQIGQGPKVHVTGKYLETTVGVNPGKDQRGYAGIVSSGSRPHVITARRGKYLKFKVGGVTLFRRRVNHPGTRPNTYLTRWLKEFTR